MNQRPKVVIVGGGFAGLTAARALKRTDAEVVLIDRRNFHLFQPLLYQVATGALSPANIASPLRAILRRNKNVEVLLGEVTNVDLKNREIILDQNSVKYDYLIVATGATHSYFGNDQWEKFAPGLKTIEDATAIRGRVLQAFEAAEKCESASGRAAWLTFVVVGGGPTGVEMAGALAEIAQNTLKHDFRKIDPADAKIILIEAGPRVLAPFTEKLSAAAERSLRKLSVEVLPNTKVTAIDDHSVTYETVKGTQTVDTKNVVWAAGVKSSPMAAALALQCGSEVDRQGRITVNKDLSLPGFSNVFVLGDTARALDSDGKPLPGIAPVAMQQGKYVAKHISQRIADKPTSDFQYKDLGMMAVVGRSSAVAKLGKWEFSGAIGWFIWLVIHLVQLVQLENRLLVFMQWAWSFFTFSRSARLITNVEIAESAAASPHVGSK